MSDLASGVAEAGRGVMPQGDLGMLGEALAEQGADLDAALAALGGMGADGAGQAQTQGNGPARSGPPGSMPGAAPATDAPRLGAPGARCPWTTYRAWRARPVPCHPIPTGRACSRLSASAPRAAVRAASSAPLTATGETAAVPTERREVVRGYFGNDGGR